MNPFDIYLAKIEADLRGGKATEYTYRSSLEHLLETLEKGVDASSDPKHIACGAPDFIVERGQVPLGYVETKDIKDDLDKIEKSDQLKRYRQSLHNLILTNYLEFRWYVNGNHKLTARIADVGAGKKLVPNHEGIKSATQLFQEFYQTEVPTVGTPKELAERMAQITKLVRDLIINALQREEDKYVDGVLHKQYNTFREHLLPNLKPDEFADIYAQTMAYGLFAACLSAPTNSTFNRATAYQYLTANRFLRRLFLDVGEELDGTVIAPFLDDIASLLAHADMAEILRDFGKRTRTEDPVVHFYETFLAAYDPKLRESWGVYYTPEPVVQFIVNSIDWLLKNRFYKPMGLADSNVHLLDPASGTGTFLYFVIRSIHDLLMGRNQGGTWREYVHEKLLTRIFGFELLMAPYVVAHLKLGLLLKDLNYSWLKDDRLKIYLTNTLDEGITRAETLGDIGWYISQEASDAAGVKKEMPIMVVLGNPPYSNFGMLNKNEWILGLLKDYKEGLHERKINLDDDYIKFLRFGQWRIDQTGQGILAFITNNSFIDGITHRQMRRSLMATFTDIFILDLHGSSMKQEKAPNGSKDENVFDIQQGVAISIFVKDPNKKGPANVHHAELWGTRKSKYDILSSTNISAIEWKVLDPTEEFSFFVPKSFSKSEEYNQYFSIPGDVFIERNAGIQTKRDKLIYHFTRAELQKVLDDFRKLDSEELRKKYELPPDGRDWKINNARMDIKSQKGKIIQVAYHPFDNRWTLYTGKTKGFMAYPRSPLMGNALQENLLLLTVRNPRRGNLDSFFVSDKAVDKDGVSPFDNVTFFPLYLYTTPESTQGTLFAQAETSRTSNLAPEFIKALSEKMGLDFVPDGKGDLIHNYGPEDVFHYAYAVFHSQTYRDRYAELLKIGFPRLPLISDKILFNHLTTQGADLVGLHLLKSPLLDSFLTSFSESGTNAVDRVKYEDGKVWINDTQYYGGLAENVWKFKVGGYQVCDKWLKDRKGRTLSSDDINYYQQIVVAIHETIRIMAEIDNSIVKWPIE